MLLKLFFPSFVGDKYFKCPFKVFFIRSKCFKKRYETSENAQKRTKGHKNTKNCDERQKTAVEANYETHRNSRKSIKTV